MFEAFLLVFCLVTVQANFKNTQPVVTPSFDKTLEDVLTASVQPEYVATVRKTRLALRTVFAPCRETQATEIHQRRSSHAIVENLCGTIGYTDPYIVSDRWIIHRLNSYSGIKLTVTYLQLPLLTTYCRQAFVRISHSAELCGLKSGLIFYESYIWAIVYYEQKVVLGEDNGFIIVYSAFQEDSIVKKESHIHWERGNFGIALIKPSVSAGSLPQDVVYAWFIVAELYNIIYFPNAETHGYTIYDGPWYKSPIARGKYTTGPCAYIAQTIRTSRDLEWKFIRNTNYVRQANIEVVSLPTRNTVYINKIPHGAYSLLVHRLEIRYGRFTGDYMHRCHYGGFFVYIVQQASTAKKYFHQYINFCQIQRRQEFTIQLFDPAENQEYHVYVILYSGYSEGIVSSTIKARKCSNMRRSVLKFGCNYLQDVLQATVPMNYSINGRKYGDINYLGAITVQIQVVDLIYSVPRQDLTLHIIDQDIYYQEKYFYSVNVKDMISDFSNPHEVWIEYAPQDVFTTFSLIAIEVHYKTYSDDFSYVDNSTRYDFSELSLPFDSVSKSEVSGRTNYRISMIAITASLVQFEMSMDGSDQCVNKNMDIDTVRITIYIPHLKSLSFTLLGIPLRWANTMTHSSFEVLITLPPECRNSKLVFALQPVKKFFNSALHLSQPTRPISWNDASKECQQRGMALLRPSHHISDYYSFFNNAMDQARRTGNYSAQILLLRLPILANEYSRLSITGLIQIQTERIDHFPRYFQGTKYTVSWRYRPLQTFDSLPFIIPGTHSDSEGRCNAFVLRFDMMEGAFVRVACNASMPAVFICREEMLQAMSLQEVFMMNYSTAYSRSLSEHNVSIIHPPSLTCPYPWLPIAHICLGIIAAPESLNVSDDWPERLCAASNASVYHQPAPLDDEITANISDLLHTTVKAQFTLNVTRIVTRSSTNAFCEMSEIRPWARSSKKVNCSEQLFRFSKEVCTACVRHFRFNYDEEASNIIKSFRCLSGSFIPEAFHCDGIIQCSSGDDEKNCPAWKKSHKGCSPFSLLTHKRDGTCSSWCPRLYVACVDGSCIPMDAICNGFADCADGWDEDICHSQSLQLVLNKPAMLSQHKFMCFDLKSLYDASLLCIYDLTESGDISGCRDYGHLIYCEPFSCPFAYKCRGSYCIPLRRLCDGSIDCLHGDDELACETFLCPGLLQCRESNICIPPWEMCDGHVHCKPFQEDEVYCDACPAGFLCHGRAAKCSGDVLPDLLPSSLKVLVCTHQTHIRQILPNVASAPSLIFLDIQHTMLTDAYALIALENWLRLVQINAAHNNLTIFPRPRLNSYPTLKVLVLSFNKISMLQSYDLVAFSNIQVLVLHHNQISVLQSNSFGGVESLLALDLTDNDITQVMAIPSESPMLHWVESDQHYICCLLPSVDVCTPTSSTFSSCKNLLQINVHRILIYGQAILTFVTNSIVLISKQTRTKRECYQLINLALGNLMMSCYLILIASVDVYYKNEFHVIAVSWKRSILCKMAATLSTIGSEVSLSLMVYIALFRAYTIHSLYKRLSVRTTWTACLVIWAVWSAYAVGLSVVTSSYGQPLDSNICIYVSFHTLSDTISQFYSTVFIVVNLLLVIQLFALYGFIAWRVVSVQKSVQTQSSKTRKQQQTLSVRLSSILLFTVLCWLPLLLCQLLNLLGVSLPNTVPIWMAILILPINASFSAIMFGIIPALASMRQSMKR